MNRFIRKSWYTLTESAEYLTQNTQGEARVTVSDLLQLASEGEVIITLRLFSMAPASEGELTVLVRPDDQLFDADGPPATRVHFCSNEQYEEIIKAETIVHHGPPTLVFETWLPDGCIKHELGFIPVGLGKAILRALWRDSLRGTAENPDQLPRTIASDDPHLSVEPIFLSIPDPEGERVARTTLADLPEDTFLGVTREHLDMLLSDSNGAPAGGSLSNRAIADEQLPEELDLLVTAWRRFWKNTSYRDRDTWPSKEHVVEWLKANGLSGKNADAGATIISPDWARKGGRR